MSVIDEFKAVGIDIPANINSGQHKIMCPRAKDVCGRKNWKEKCLSVSIDEKLYNCQHCPDFKGKVGDTKLSTTHTERKQYELPKRPNITKLSQKGLDYFTGRKITQEVVNANKIAEENGWLVYPYHKDGVLTNYQKRKIGSKDFRQAPGAMPIVFNYDRCWQNVTEGSKEIIITEGVEDGLSFEVAGFPFHTSVNQGAPNVQDKDASNKIACIDNCYDLFEKAEVIYIAVDNDPNGKRLEQELVRRFGEEKCKTVDFGEYKDANEVLKWEGKEKLVELKENAKFVRIAEVYTAKDAKDELVRQLKEGRVKGSTTYFTDIDQAWTWRKKELNLWSGYANEGKSLILNQLALLKAVHDGWKFAVLSPENFPVEEYFDDFVQMYVGKPTDNSLPNCITENELKEALDFLESHFFVVYPDKDFTIEHIHAKLKALVRRHGIDGVIVDPFNWLANRQKGNENRDQYITSMLSDMKRFCNEQDVSYNLVAHQLKPEKDGSGNYKAPDAYKVKGASDFMDKVDNMILIQRPFVATDYRNPLVEFTTAKIKKPKLVGKRGIVVPLEYDYKTMRYHQESDKFCPLAGRSLGAIERISPEQAYSRNDIFKSQSSAFDEPAIKESDWKTDNEEPLF
ncbi:bifunctional DNA primase/helicase [Roseivirga spongicola]|uniref:bifunctional DNA primase/helicase n=1 Tax=Roseivirga spongicola TaxID=333140 RepID=UPI002AC9D1E1|nr:bifunctional DNA primase/helicase [Roseivirga spongicola]WPZ08799.1 bifunctional DNA primase/helicase [Roseivirga spongicola]